MALPSNALKEIEVESDIYPGRVYFLRPALVSDRPTLNAARVKGAQMADEIRRDLNTYRITIDFSDRFTDEECQQINHLSLKSNQDDADDLTEDELALLSKADTFASIKDEAYLDMVKQANEWRQKSNIEIIAHLLVRTETNGVPEIPDSRSETEAWLNTLLGGEFEKLVLATNDLSQLSPAAEKNSEPLSISA